MHLVMHYIYFMQERSETFCCWSASWISAFKVKLQFGHSDRWVNIIITRHSYKCDGLMSVPAKQRECHFHPCFAFVRSEHTAINTTLRPHTLDSTRTYLRCVHVPLLLHANKYALCEESIWRMQNYDSTLEQLEHLPGVLCKI
jgi:hypothetical protein